MKNRDAASHILNLVLHLLAYYVPYYRYRSTVAQIREQTFNNDDDGSINERSMQLHLMIL